jgi:hypothetical protein
VLKKLVEDCLDLHATTKGFGDALLAATAPLCCCSTSCSCGGVPRPK